MKPEGRGHSEVHEGCFPRSRTAAVMGRGLGKMRTVNDASNSLSILALSTPEGIVPEAGACTGAWGWGRALEDGG